MSEKKLLIIAFCYLVLDIFSFSLILPWLPTVFESFEERSDYLHGFLKKVIERISLVLFNERNSAWDNVVLGGFITSAFSLCQCLSSTMAGALSDVYSRNPLLITLQTLSVIAHLLTAWLSTSFTCFFCFRLLCGATRANVAVLTALVSDHSQTGSRSRAMAVVGAAYSIGFTLGPLTSALTISSLADHFQSARLLQHIGYGSALLNVIGLLFLGASLPPVRTEINKGTSTTTVRSPALEFFTWRRLFSFHGLTERTAGDICLRRVSLVWFLYLLVFSGLEFTLLFLTRSRFGYNSRDQGRMFFFLGIVMILIQGGLIRRFRFNQAHLGALSIISLSVACVVLGAASEPLLFYTGLLLFAFASAAFVPCFQAMVSLLAKPDRQGHVLGLYRSLNALARAVGPAFVSTLFWLVGPFQCYALCGCLLVILCMFYVRIEVPLPRNLKYQ